MDLTSPPSVLLSQTDAGVLSVLAGTTKGLSGREVDRLVGLSHNAVWKSLRRLVEHGLVTEEEAGANTLLYRLNRDHLAADAAITLTRLRSILIQRLEESISAWPLPPTHASLFGSAARGDGSTESDVDIFLVRPKAVTEEDEQWRSQLNELAKTVLAWTGNHAGISELAESDLPRLRRERPPVVEDVEKDGLTLYGKDVKQLFGRAR